MRPALSARHTHYSVYLGHWSHVLCDIEQITLYIARILLWFASKHDTTSSAQSRRISDIADYVEENHSAEKKEVFPSSELFNVTAANIEKLIDT